jgi:hypothetical protein
MYLLAFQCYLKYEINDNGHLHSIIQQKSVLHVFLFIPQLWQSDAVNRMTNTTVSIRKMTERQAVIYKTLCRKLKNEHVN